ncbi:MAG: hypothetical protein JSU92_12525 [Deltaproteobacteria bacterium]|nr:MAG: hypothetical protein JSU92_12525 [Deltaproteobacteria bacterium]
MLKRAIIITLAVLAFVAISFFVYRLIFPEKALVLASLEGVVEIESGGVWIPLKPGDKIYANSRIRSKDNSVAMIQMGEDSFIKVESGSELLLQEVSGDRIRAKLEEGKLSAALKEGVVPSVQVEAGGSETIIESKGGEFAVAADPKGSLTVAATRGELSLAGQKGVTQMTPGEVAMAAPDKQMVKSEVSRNVFLEVNWPWPSAVRTNKREVLVTGSTAVGAQVTINGVKTSTDFNGNFVSLVPLQEGRNVIIVTSVGILGDRKEAISPEIMVDTTLPEIEIKTRDLWE